jgi:hypothetical protein
MQVAFVSLNEEKDLVSIINDTSIRLGVFILAPGKQGYVLSRSDNSPLPNVAASAEEFLCKVINNRLPVRRVGRCQAE